MKAKIVTLLLLLATLAGMSCKKEEKEWWKTHPAKNPATWKLDAATPIEKRVAPPPDYVMDYYNKFDGELMDKDKPFRPYTPTARETAEIEAVIRALPAEYIEKLKPRLLGIYFVENMIGTGLTDFAPGKDGENFVFMLFNPSSLRISASEWITSKEKTAFKFNEPGWELNIDLGGEGSGFYYIFLHEISHAYDYVAGVTPLEPGSETAINYVRLFETGGAAREYPFTAQAWIDFDKPAAFARFKGIDKVTFYGLNDGPKLSITDASQVYSALETKPFATLYATMNWMEDFAELMAAYMHTRTYGRPWTLTVSRDGKAVYRINDPLARKSMGGRVDFAEKLLRDGR